MATIKEEYPAWYSSVSVVLAKAINGRTVFNNVWLSTNSCGEGYYWNFPDGVMKEVEDDDKWQYNGKFISEI